jgi:hypothetical protein
MADVFSLLQMAPQATKLLSIAQRAANGDSEAIAYLRQGGWSDLLDLTVRPGAGQLTRDTLTHAREVYRGIQHLRDGGPYVDAEYRVLSDPPWNPFLRRLLKQPYGGHIILGPVGSGKTTLALKLGQRCHVKHGYRVECVNMYGSDVPEWASTISKDTLTKRMLQLSKYLDSQAEHDEDEEAEDTTKNEKLVNLPPRRRVIILDEASLGLTNNPNDPARRSAIQALTQCRHLDWIVIYIGQWAGQLPLAILGQTAIWVKRPDGREALTDRDNPVVRDLWLRATDAFRSLEHSTWYMEPWLDQRSWAFCDCQSLGGDKGYSGLIPFTPPNTEADGIEAEYEESWQEEAD